MMPVSFEFLRGVLGVLCVLFAHFAGRTAVLVKKGQQRVSKLYAWILRGAACAFAISIRHPTDSVDIGVWGFSVLAFALGWWVASREKKIDDLTHEIFPEN